MQPQTNAELTAWNYGRDLAIARGHGLPDADAFRAVVTDDTYAAIRGAVATLGHDIFATWADQGFAAHQRDHR